VNGHPTGYSSSVDDHTDRRLREQTEGAFGYVEDFFYVAVAAALAIAGLMLFGYALWDFTTHLGQQDFTASILSLLDNLLLVFIVTELIHTVRAIIDEKVLVAEPFLIVGIVAAIRRLIVVSAEAKNLLGTAQFPDAMLEIGVLTVSVLVLAGSVFLMRSTVRSEPPSAHDPETETPSTKEAETQRP
jgi:uncharacterized membrane protein (DUF373 family)